MSSSSLQESSSSSAKMTEKHAVPQIGESFTILSWNLLRAVGAPLDEVVELARSVQPDIFLMQEAVDTFDRLPEILGGHYARIPLPDRIHGTACWSRFPFNRAPVSCALPSGLMVRRTAQLIDFSSFSIANVHLSHGQILNRRQLRRIAPMLRHHALVMGDFNLVGPTLLPGFNDVGPRAATHRMADMLPIRIDRCLVRGMTPLGTAVLPNQSSDHHPIRVTLQLEAPDRHRSFFQKFKDRQSLKGKG
ncbi:endonuclease/exonuclease/phosphatase family protein [Asaia astilbis]|uniref:endonuclease/exonuclease/phosphatase family protein n=1 Tax=Asaia astilbis TaxID=610244 RepID=UPI000AAE8F1B|nr:endonuclease/exonuclease/phosphatase family protein [Asaia astilbis]